MNDFGQKRILFSYIQEYIGHISKCKSRNTIDNYGRMLNNFGLFAGDVLLNHLSEKLINEDYLEYLKSKKYKASYCGRALQIVRFFLQYLHSKNLITFDPNLISDRKILKSEGIYSNRYKDNSITDFQYSQMIEYWKADDNIPRQLRNSILIQILFETGLAVNELRHITRFDIDLNQCLLNVNSYAGKNNYKNRKIPISVDLVTKIKRYYETRFDSCPCLFVSFKNRGKQSDYIIRAWSLTAKSIEEIVKFTALEVGIDSITPKSFRNTLIEKKVREGWKMDDVNRFFGFNINTRRYYAKRYGVKPLNRFELFLKNKKVWEKNIDTLKKIEHACLNCNKLFQPKNFNQKFCGNECGKKYNKKTKSEKNEFLNKCAYCGNIIYEKNRKYCNKICQTKMRKLK